MCTHSAALNDALEGVTENGAPIYAPKTVEQLAAQLEHFVTCW